MDEECASWNFSKKVKTTGPDISLTAKCTCVACARQWKKPSRGNVGSEQFRGWRRPEAEEPGQKRQENGKPSKPDKAAGSGAACCFLRIGKGVAAGPGGRFAALTGALAIIVMLAGSSSGMGAVSRLRNISVLAGGLSDPAGQCLQLTVSQVCHGRLPARRRLPAALAGPGQARFTL